jgi:hypothetical protein
MEEFPSNELINYNTPEPAEFQFPLSSFATPGFGVMQFGETHGVCIMKQFITAVIS